MGLCIEGVDFVRTWADVHPQSNRLPRNSTLSSAIREAHLRSGNDDADEQRAKWHVPAYVLARRRA
jgi:hypothetical protein